MRKLVLDKDYTYALVRRAYIDGYAKPYSKAAEENSYSKMLLERGAQIHIQKEILPIMLLYDEVYIEPFDNFVLKWEDKVVYPSRENKTGFLKIKDGSLRFLSSESVKKYLEKFPPETILEVITTLLKNRYKLNLNKDQLLKILKEKIPEEYDIIQRRHLELMVKIYGTSIIDELLKKSGWHYSKKVLDESTYKKYVNELKQLEDKLRIYRPCVTVYLDICEKLEFCQKLDAHLKLNIALPIKMISNINIKPEEEEFSAFIGIFVKNLKWVVPHSYSDLIRLVDDRRIADFRSYFWSCLEDVREGKLTIDEVERKLRKANEVITSIERTERLSFISWLCLPLSILGYIVPQLSSLSKVISLVSTSINIRNFILKRKYRWAMVGLKL